ncbi:hypothetical protein FCIRC_8021 [Fusarium circinatum]|uniref:Uncharacterized protein n=1 Tax=Fusarium circinatum TaxID=48490 RepID=A0A8H5TQC3_FUSCI|nr:hypothetical protein FCIRC_8021 [Fusarium circinatum]
MAPNPDYVYCTICGMDLDEDTVVLAGPHWPTYGFAPLKAQVASQEIVRYAAEVESYPGQLLLLPDREQSKTPPAKMYMGIHAACDNIANRAIKSPSNVKVGSINELWFVLERRCARYLGQLLEQRPQPRDMNYVPPIPNNSPGQPMSLGFERYYVPYPCMEQWGDEWEGWLAIHQWDEDPIDIPNLTSSLLANLERLDDSSAKTSAEALPEELNDHVHDFFYDTQALPKDNYLFSQPVWKEIFLQIPFLWDLDTQAVHDKTGLELEEVKKWNWEKLTRQILSSPHPAPTNAASYRDEGIWDYAEVGLNVPGGFTNRRRIWQILEDMQWEDT